MLSVIEASDIHTVVNHLHETIGVPTGRAQSAADFGLAAASILSLEDWGELYTFNADGWFLYSFHINIITVAIHSKTNLI